MNKVNVERKRGQRTKFRDRAMKFKYETTVQNKQMLVPGMQEPRSAG